MSGDNNDPHPLLHGDDLSSIPLSHHDPLPSADNDLHDPTGPSLDGPEVPAPPHPSDLPLPHSHSHNQLTSDHHVEHHSELPQEPHPLSSVHHDHSDHQHLPLPPHPHDHSGDHQSLPVPVPDQHGELPPVHDADHHAPLGEPEPHAHPSLPHPSLPLPGPGDHVSNAAPLDHVSNGPPLSADHVGDQHVPLPDQHVPLPDQHVPLPDQHGGLPVHVVSDTDMTGPGGGGLHDEHDHAMALHMSDYGLHSGMLDGDGDDPDHDMHMTIPEEYADVSIKDIQRAREKATQRPAKPTRRRKRGPKASQSAFAFFRFEILGEICEQHPDASPDAIMNMVEQKWSMLTDHEKQQYQVKANEDESRYSEEVKLYLPKSQGGVMKRKKARKHPQAPKHPMSAYLYFVADHRQKLKALHPDKGFTDIARMLGEQWRKLDPALRAAYEQRASLDKERYKGEKDNFQPTPVDENKDAKRKKKHPLAPKHPLSAYLFFVATNRPKMNAEHPDKDFTEVAQMLGNMWKNLPAHQKKKYEILAFADKKRYLEEKEKWTPPIEKPPPAPKKAADGSIAGMQGPIAPPQPVAKERSRSPTRSKAAYNLWVVDNRHDLPPNLDPKQADKILRQRWKNTADEYRAPYFELAEKQPPMHFIPQARMDPQAMHKQPHPSAMMPPPPTHMHVMPPGMASPNVAPVQPPSAAGAGGADPKKRGRPRKYQATSEVLSWNSHEIGRFIASLGLGEHKDKFVRSGITGEQFINLSSPQLRDNFMIANIGDRKKIIKGIQNLTK